MFTFMAGATTTGAVDAKYNVVRKSSAIPRANFAMISAVAGATRSRSVLCATAMCSIALSRFASLPEESPNRSVMTFCPLSAANVSGVTNSRASHASPPAPHTQTGSPELLSAWSFQSYPPKRCQKLFHSRPPSHARATQGGYDRLRFASRAFHILIHHAKIVVLAELRNFVARLGQPPCNLLVRILAPAAQPTFQLLARRRQNKNRHRLGNLFFHLRRALNVDLQHQIESLPPRFLQPLFRRAVRMLSKNPRVLQKFAARNHGVEFRFRYEIIAFPAGLGRPARPCST